MIKVEIIPLRERISLKAIMTESELTELLLASKSKIEHAVKDLVCSDHPETESTIFLLGSSDSRSLTEVYRCCCPKFRDEIREKLRKPSSI